VDYGGVKRTGKDEPIGIVINTYMHGNITRKLPV
jgi:hypothetical protein